MNDEDQGESVAEAEDAKSSEETIAGHMPLSGTALERSIECSFIWIRNRGWVAMTKSGFYRLPAYFCLLN